MRCLSFVLCIAIALLAAWGLFTTSEVARVRSPGGRLEAVLIETNGGATTSFGYEVFVVPSGWGPGRAKLVADFYGATRSESAYGVNLRWHAADALVIEYLDAQQEELALPVALVAGQRVRVALRRGVSDPAAPAGGMLYNRERRSGPGH
jgi:hypothetical protein